MGTRHFLSDVAPNPSLKVSWEITARATSNGDGKLSLRMPEMERSIAKVKFIPRSFGPVFGLLVGLSLAQPWFNGGGLRLLDFGPSSKGPLIVPNFIGLNGGLILSIPTEIIGQVSVWAAGQLGTVILIILFFPLAIWSFFRLVGRGEIARYTAALLFVVNPFVYDRIYAGQINVLFGYALLPAAVDCIAGFNRVTRFGWARLSLCWIGLIALSAHFVWIFGVVLFAYTLVGRLNRASIIKSGTAAITAAMATTYAIVAGKVGGVGQDIGVSALASYRTQGDPHYGLFFNLLGLYGFWRKGPLLAKDLITGWPLILLAILIVSAVGYYRVFSTEKNPDPLSALRDKRLGWILLISGVMGLFLAAGDQGPTGFAFKWMFIHVPYFAIMREPQKFLMLTALAEVFGFAHGATSLYEKATSRAGKTLTVVVLAALPVMYEPLIFGGLAGQVKTSQIPAVWSQVNARLGGGQGVVLVLPWHQYLAVPFAQNRVIANPIPGLLERKSISGDNIQLPNQGTTSTVRRSLYLGYLYQHGYETRYFGSLVAPLGIKYVILAKWVDYRSYGWLYNQVDMKVIFDSSGVVVFQNLDYQGLGQRVSSVVRVPDWGSLISLSQFAPLTGRAFVVSHAGPGPITPPPGVVLQSPVALDQSNVVRRLTLTCYKVNAGNSGFLQIAEEYNSGWRISGVAPIETAQGSELWRVGSGPANVVFAPITEVLLGYGISISTILVLVGLLIIERRKDSGKAGSAVSSRE